MFQPHAKLRQMVSARVLASAAVLLLVLCPAVTYLVWGLLSQRTEAPAPRQYQTVNLDSRYLGLDENSPVIGISVGGRYRAYLLKAFLRPESHVYNDLIDKVPITVTYCDLGDCVRVFTGPPQERPLDIGMGGWDGRHHGKMLLHAGSTRYWQETGLPLEDATTTPFPYARADFVRTTWGKWRQAHPDTDVYVGRVSGTSADPTIKLVRPILPDDGVQCRLRPDRARWGADEVPSFKADIRNGGERHFVIIPAPEGCQLEVDDRVQEWRGAVTGKESALAPGDQVLDVPFQLVEQWQDRKDNRPLRLTPGKHNLRVVFLLKPLDGGKPLQVLSPQVAIEVAAGGQDKTNLPAEKRTR